MTIIKTIKNLSIGPHCFFVENTLEEKMVIECQFIVLPRECKKLMIDIYDDSINLSIKDDNGQ